MIPGVTEQSILDAAAVAAEIDAIIAVHQLIRAVLEGSPADKFSRGYRIASIILRLVNIKGCVSTASKALPKLVLYQTRSPNRIWLDKHLEFSKGNCRQLASDEHVDIYWI